MKVAVEHFEMAGKVFTSIKRKIDPVLCERFAEVLARESQGCSRLLRENLELRKKLVLLTTAPAAPAIPKTLTVEEEEVARL